MVSMLSASDAMPMSRSERFSCITRPNSQRSENGASVSDEAAVGAQQHGLAGPHLAQPQLVHRHRRIGRRTRAGP